MVDRWSQAAARRGWMEQVADAPVAATLDGLGLAPYACPDGVVVRIAGGGRAPVLLRADVAAPSATALLGVAAALADAPPARDVVLLWRPDGRTHPDDRGEGEAFAVRLAPDLPASRVHLRAGATTAHGDTFRVDYRPGRPPGDGDAVLAAGELVTRLRYSVAQLAREEPVAASVTAVRIAEGIGHLDGTLHAHSPAQRDALRTEVDRLARCTALAVGVAAEVTVADGPAAVVSDPAYVERLRDAIGDAAPVVDLDAPLLAVDDLSRLLDGRRGALAVVGTGGPADDLGPALVTAAALHLLAADGLPPAPVSPAPVS